MATALAYGYIDRFGSVSLSTANLRPIACRLKSAKSARIITTFNGVAVNVDANLNSAGRYPVEQRLDLLIAGNTPGGGVAVDDILQTLAAMRGRQASLRIRVPSGGRTYTAPAVLDWLEIVDDGRMDDSGIVNLSRIALYFQQMDDFV